MKKGLKIESVEYLDGYTLRIKYSDGKVNDFDFTTTVMRDHEETLPYRDVEEFKKFVVDKNRCEIYWGEDCDMILLPDTLYHEKEATFS